MAIVKMSQVGFFSVVVAFILGAFESLLPVMKRKYRSSEMNTFQDDPTQTIQEIEK